MRHVVTILKNRFRRKVWLIARDKMVISEVQHEPSVTFFLHDMSYFLQSLAKHSLLNTTRTSAVIFYSVLTVAVHFVHQQNTRRLSALQGFWSHLASPLIRIKAIYICGPLHAPHSSYPLQLFLAVILQCNFYTIFIPIGIFASVRIQ
jgi:hypothetical protein